MEKEGTRRRANAGANGRNAINDTRREQRRALCFCQTTRHDQNEPIYIHIHIYMYIHMSVCVYVRIHLSTYRYSYREHEGRDQHVEIRVSHSGCSFHKDPVELHDLINLRSADNNNCLKINNTIEGANPKRGRVV